MKGRKFITRNCLICREKNVLECIWKKDADINEIVQVEIGIWLLESRIYAVRKTGKNLENPYISGNEETIIQEKSMETNIH